MSSAVSPPTVSQRCQEAVNCTICQDTLTSSRSLPCAHTFCLSCLKFQFKEKKEGEEIICPTCYSCSVVAPGGLEDLPINLYSYVLTQEWKQRHEARETSQSWEICSVCTVNVLEPDQYVESSAQAASNQQAESLSENVDVVMDNIVSNESNIHSTPVGHYCYECNLIYCNRCAVIHSKMREAEGHDIKSFETLSKLDTIKPPACQVHPTNQLRFYCYTCGKIGCSQCMSKLHINHPYANLKDASLRVRANIQRIFTSLTARMDAACKEFKKEIHETHDKMVAFDRMEAAKPQKVGTGLRAWLKRKLPFSNSDIEEDDGQSSSKKLCLEEKLHSLTEDLEMIENHQKQITHYKEKVEKIEPTYTYADLVRGSLVDSIAGDSLLNAVVPSIRDHTVNGYHEQQQQQQNKPGVIGTIIEAFPIELTPATVPRLERCLALVVGHEKFRFLWKVQLYSINDPSHFRKMKFAPSFSMRGTLAHLASDIIYAVSAGGEANRLWEYSHFAGSWSHRTQMPLSKRGVGVISYSQSLFFFGGSNNGIGIATASTSIQIFNTISNSWTVVTSGISAPVCEPMCVVYNGLIYLFGGRTAYHERTRTVQVYNPLTTHSQIIEDMPCRHPFHVLRWQHYALFIGRVAGCVYNFVTRQWYSRKRFRTGMHYFSVDIIDDTIHLVGGRCHGAECWRYVDMKSLPVLDFIEDRQSATWELRHTTIPNKVSRQQRYKVTTAGSVNASFV